MSKTRGLPLPLQAVSNAAFNCFAAYLVEFKKVSRLHRS
jgi:hypothetical protein